MESGGPKPESRVECDAAGLRDVLLTGGDGVVSKFWGGGWCSLPNECRDGWRQKGAGRNERIVGMMVTSVLRRGVEMAVEDLGVGRVSGRADVELEMKSQVKSNALKMAEDGGRDFPGWTAQKKVDTHALRLGQGGEWGKARGEKGDWQNGAKPWKTRSSSILAVEGGIYQ